MKIRFQYADFVKEGDKVVPFNAGGWFVNFYLSLAKKLDFV
jgi:hypothetical protein